MARRKPKTTHNWASASGTLSDEHLKALGLIAVNFTALESHVSFFVWCLIGDEQHVGQIVTARMSFARQVDLLSALIRHRTTDVAVLHDLDLFVQQVSQAEEQRNTLMHSAWMTSRSLKRTDVSRLKITSGRKGLAHHHEVVSAAQVMKVASLIGDAARRALLFLGFLEHKNIVKPPRPTATRSSGSPTSKA